MDTIMSATTILTVISVVLLIVLLVVYFKNLRDVKSKLLLGLIVFSLVFLIQNGMSIYFYFSMTDYYVSSVRTHVFILSLLEAIAFAIMLWISWD